MYDPYEWRVKRSVSMVSELAAENSQPVPTLQQLDAAQMAGLNKKVEKAQAMAKQTAPMMADVGKVMEKCGGDEACMTREAMKMGGAMAGTPQMETMTKIGKEGMALADSGPVRYQAWYAKAQKGSYVIDETAHISVTDPICFGKPRNRCTRNETRKGAGAVPVLQDTGKTRQASPGAGAAELDLAKNTITLRLPLAMMLPYTETIVTDEPEGTHDTPTPKGPQQKQLAVLVDTKDGIMNAKPFTVQLKGGWRSQSGEQVVNINGKFGNGGKLTVRWKFVTQ